MARKIVPGAEEKVCQRQTRKGNNVAEIDRKAEVGDTQAREEEGVGGSERLIVLVVPLRYVNKIWTFLLRGWRAFRCRQPWECCAEGQGDAGSADCFALNGTLLSPSSLPLAALLRASVPVNAGAGDGGVIGWPQRSPCPLICGEQSRPKGAARW